MILHDMPQGSPEWHSVRAGKLTASEAQAIATNGKGLETLCWETMARLHSSSSEASYCSPDMERGKELEGVAVMMYELQNSIATQQVGFVELDKFAGCSPDRLVGEDGLLEVKCPKDSIYFRLLAGGSKPDTAHLWQAQMQMLVCGRKWCDLAYFNPNFRKSLLIHRILPDEAMMGKLMEGLETGRALIKKIKKACEALNGH